MKKNHPEPPEEDIEEQAEKLCNADFDLVPHQIFVRNFLSFQTPYNSLLLYHGLGSGKTCSAISVSEEMRTYMNQLGITQRIIVVASPNVQDNFKLQLSHRVGLSMLVTSTPLALLVLSPQQSQVYGLCFI